MEGGKAVCRTVKELGKHSGCVSGGLELLSLLSTKGIRVLCMLRNDWRRRSRDRRASATVANCCGVADFSPSTAR